MNKDGAELESTAGSIATTQSYPKGKMPTPVRVLLCVWRSTKGDDGKSYGRTANVELHSLPSGTVVLSDLDTTVLQCKGLTQGALDRVNARLKVLAVRASAHAAQVAAMRAVKSIGTVEALVRELPAMRVAAHALLVDAAARIARGDTEAGESRADAPGAASRGEGQAGNRLLSALMSLNQAASAAQVAYRQLAKGEEPPSAAVLEFQRSWFLVQGMVEALRGRDCFYRPGGWSELKQQVLVEGRPWRKGDLVPKKGDAEAE